MESVKQGDKVRVHYTGKLQDGTVFDSSVEREEPIEFSIGEGRVIPGFEQAVVGMSPGDSKVANIPAGEAYGDHRPEMVVSVDRQQIPSDLNVQVGQQLQIRQGDNQTIPVIVTDVSDAKVTLDANHPLAGQDLVFDIELVEVV